MKYSGEREACRTQGGMFGELKRVVDTGCGDHVADKSGKLNGNYFKNDNLTWEMSSFKQKSDMVCSAF